MTKEEFDKRLPLAIPIDIAKCPICKAPVMISEINDWIANDNDGQISIDESTLIYLQCSTEPMVNDMDDDEDFHEHMKEHWARPIQDWGPVEKTVKAWLMTQLAQ